MLQHVATEIVHVKATNGIADILHTPDGLILDRFGGISKGDWEIGVRSQAFSNDGLVLHCCGGVGQGELELSLRFQGFATDLYRPHSLAFGL